MYFMSGCIEPEGHREQARKASGDSFVGNFCKKQLCKKREGMGRQTQRMAAPVTIHLDSPTKGTLAVEVWEADPEEKVGTLGDSGSPLSCQRAIMGGHLGVPDCSHEGPQRAVFEFPTSWPLPVYQRCEGKQQGLRGKGSSCDPSPLPHGTLRPVRVSYTLCWGQTLRWAAGNWGYILNWAVQIY